MIKYTADKVGCEKFNETLIAGIGNESVGYVMFQRGTTRETGSDEPPYFEFNDQLNGGIDWLKSVDLNREQLNIEVHSEKTEVGNFSIKLSISDSEFNQLVSQLKLIFEGFENLLNIK